VASDPVRIELRGIVTEREAAQRDLQATLGALEEKLLPARAARRLVREHNPAMVLAGVVMLGVAVGFARDDTVSGRATSIAAAAVAGAIAYHLAR